MAFVVHHTGGNAMDDELGANLLGRQPEHIHQHSPCFMGSAKDMEELQK
jgi:fructose-1,6-bisphosphatase